MSIVSSHHPPAFQTVIHMRWERLLFMHWPVPAEALRALVPEPLAIDTFDDSAYVAIVPFTMSGIRPPGFPPVPWLSAFHELNVRTYVHLNGLDPGVWFFSLEAARLPAVLFARRFYHLNYVHARMRLETDGDSVRYSSRRLREPRGYFRGTYTAGPSLAHSIPGTLESFLTERYCLYARSAKGRLYRSRIGHVPWPLQTALIDGFESDLLEANGIGQPSGEPLLHYSHTLDVRSSWPERCG